MSILEMNEERINELEQYLEINCRNVIDMFKEYQNTKPFTFLPGHRECIFGIKSEILKLQNSKKLKTTTNRGLGEDELKMALEAQVSTFANNNGIFHIDWAGSIKNFKVTQSDSSVYANCSIDCPHCDSSICASYNKHWKISNLFRHLRKHSSSDHEENLHNNQIKNRGNTCDKSQYETVYVLVEKTNAENEGETEDVTCMLTENEHEFELKSKS